MPRAPLLDRGKARRVPQIVLRQRARIDRHIRELWVLANPQDWRDLSVNDRRKFCRRQSRCLRIGRPADETRQQNISSRSSIGE